MSGLALDTLRYAKRLRAAGFSEEQAEAQVEALAEAVSEALVTKQDLNEAVDKLRAEIERSNHDLRAEIERSNHDLRAEIERLNHDLRAEIVNSANSLRVELRDAQATMIRWLVPLLLGQLAAMAALIKLL